MKRNPGIVCLVLALLATSQSALATCKLENYAELPVTMDGSAPFITGAINGLPARFLVDSGAIYSMLWSNRLERFKLKATQVPGEFQIAGLGGAEYARQVTLKDFSLAGFGTGPLHDIRFLVAGSASYLSTDGLIGQNILARADTEYDLGNGVIRLFHTTGCENSSMAYWAGNTPVAVMPLEAMNGLQFQIVGAATLNGRKIRVVFDTGASQSTVASTSAPRFGFDQSKADDYYNGASGSVGSAWLEAWLARFDDLDLGGEQIKNARLWVISATLGGETDLLLGSDFFLSHRVFVAAKQRKIYFTYSGGPVFNLHKPDFGKAGTSTVGDEPGALQGTADARDEPAGSAPKSQPESPDARDAPRDASAFKRRGAAFAARGSFAYAIADFDAAIRLDSTDAESFYQRGKAKWQYRHSADAKVDLDQAVKLSPDEDRYVLQRGLVRLNTSDPVGARADFEMLTKRHPQTADLRIIDIYMTSRHYEDAITLLDQWIDRNQKSDDLSDKLNTRCWARALAGKELERALADCNASLKLDPHNSAIFDSRGLVQLRLANYDKSIEDYKSALRRDSREAWSHFGLGLAELKMGMKEEASTSMQRAKAINPRIAEEFKEIGLVP